MATIFPSLLSAPDPLQAIRTLDAHCQGYHIDVMDGVFVRNKAFDLPLITAITKATYRTLWVHLMVEDPEHWVTKLPLPPGSMVDFHFETIGFDKKLINDMKKKGWLVGVAIKPKTNVDEIFPVLDLVHQVLVMSVEPGFSGQQFLQDTTAKLDPLVGFRQTAGLNYQIAMDGGIDKNNIVMLAQKRVDQFAVASAIFEQPDPVKALKELEALVK